MYNLALLNVRLVDPQNHVDKVCHIAIEDGHIAEISNDSLTARCDTLIDMQGYVAVPGLIDVHTHMTDVFGGSQGGFRMLAKAGVCTALDVAGPSSTFFKNLQKFGSGINVATLEAVCPAVNVRDADPSAAELNNAISTALETGSIGCKLLGGHFPLTPEASARFMEETNKENAYACWHAGTTKNGNTLDSLRDMLELSGKNRLHAAHINSYCRGVIDDPAKEALCALDMLKAKPQVYSEAYLAETNGTSFCLDAQGRMQSKATGRTLVQAGYENSQSGLIQAVKDGFAHVFAPNGIETGIYTGKEALTLIANTGCNLSGGFNVNPPIPRLTLCLATRTNGAFIVDAIATDGGAIPRNVMVSHGLALVKMGMLSLQDFVRKTSINPSIMLGLRNKGQLGVGSDADITLLNLDSCAPVMAIAMGNICMFKGLLPRSGGTIITTERGKRHAMSYGLPLYMVQANDFLPSRTC